jgi:hypothetical protein
MTPLPHLIGVASALDGELNHRGGAGRQEESIEIHGDQYRSFCDVAQREKLRTRMRSSRYGTNMANFERDLDQEAWMRRRLQEAVDQLADGSADKLGRLMGYTNGGFIREILKGTKPVGKAILARINQVPKGEGWFKTAADIAYEEAAATVARELSTEGALSDLSTRAISLARRFDALTDEEHRRIAYALLDHTLQQYESLEREAGRPAAGPVRAARKPKRQPALGR